MKQLTQTQDYLLLIDEEIVCKTGELYLTSIQKRIIPKSKGVIQAGDKIIAYRRLNENAKELDLPELPPFEVYIEKLACEKYNLKEGINDYDERYYNSHNVAKAEAFIAGYKAAQYHSKQFSLEDMKIAFHKGRLYQGREGDTTFESFIQSLSTQQLPKEFIPEWTQTPPAIFRENDVPYAILKTITNSEGKQELVGVYKY